MKIHSTPTRRALLVAGAGGAGAVVLAACSGGGATDSQRSVAKAQPSEPATSADASSAPESAASESSAAGGAALAALADIEVGSSKSVKLSDGKPAIITRTAPNSVVCFSAICTHEGCTVKPAGAKLSCPCHGSQFDAKTGAVLGGPAPTALPKVAVTVEGADIVAT